MKNINAEQLYKNDYFPQTVFEKYIKLLFGLIYFQFIVEDRRPDLKQHVNMDEIIKLGYKYKTQIRLKVFWFERSVQVRSVFAPMYCKNGQQIEYTLLKGNDVSN